MERVCVSIVFDSAFGLITIAVNDFPRTQPTAVLTFRVLVKLDRNRDRDMKRIPLNYYVYIYIYIHRWNTMCIVIEFRITTVCPAYRIEMNNENQYSLLV